MDQNESTKFRRLPIISVRTTAVASLVNEFVYQEKINSARKFSADPEAGGMRKSS